ncbi:fibronectin type III domain-containing protein [Robinsoniella peoriensis]|uniref:fibronectin type III domain-containing protein n=1 Tax=Robinsoniella peoriensis TaxID=180332 RepID=UPI003640998D
MYNYDKMNLHTKRYKRAGAIMVLGFLLALFFSMSALAAPGAPSGLRQTYASEGSAKVVWNQVMGSSIRYEVEYSQDNRNWYSVGYTMTSLDCSKSGLTAGMTYYFRVRAYENQYPNKIYGPWSAGIAVATTPVQIPYQKVIQTNAGTSSVTLQWDKSAGATGYNVYQIESNQEIYIGKTAANTYTINNLKAGGTYKYKVYPERSAGGYTAVASYGTTVYDVKTVPSSVKNIFTDYGYANIKKASIQWERAENANGYEIALYSAKNKKIGSTKVINYNTNSYTFSNIKKDFYKVKVRAYIQLKTGKKYSSWSTSYIAIQPKVEGKKSGTGIKVSWDKINGATNYTVYISSKRNSGYKKATTTKSTKTIIKKYGSSRLKKGRTYYIYVIANKKVGRKTYRSSDNYTYQVRYR